MGIQFVFMGLFLFAASIIYFKVPFIRELFPAGIEGDAQFKTSYFAMFMFMAIFNGFNVRTDKLNIFEKINENKSFVKVWLAMLLATVALCMIGGPVGEIFSCTRFGIAGWVFVTLSAVTVIIVDLIRKIIFGTYKDK